MLRLTMLSIMLVLTASTALGQQQQRNTKRNYPPTFNDATVEVYKEIGDVKLNTGLLQS